MNGLCSITMNGQQVPLKFGMPACRYFMEKLEPEHVAAVSGDSINEVGIAYLLYAGYWNHCIIKDKLPEKKLEDFFDWVEDVGDDPAKQEEVKAVAECFQQSKSVNSYVDKTEQMTEELKKKLAGMRSSLSATGNSE